MPSFTRFQNVWFYFFVFSSISTTFLDERVFQNSNSEGSIVSQISHINPSPSHQASTSSGYGSKSNCRGNDHIQAGKIVRCSIPKEVTVELNEPYNTKSSEFLYSDRIRDIQTFPHKSPSSQDASTSLGILTDINSKKQYFIPREEIENHVTQVLIPDLNEPYIADSPSHSLGSFEREERIADDRMEITLPICTLQAKETSRKNKNKLSNMYKSLRNTNNKQLRIDDRELAGNNPRELHQKTLSVAEEKAIEIVSGKQPQTMINKKGETSDKTLTLNNEKLQTKFVWPVLQWQSRLVLGKKFGLSQEIKSYFERLEGSTLSSIPNKLKEIGYGTQVEMSLEKIRTNLVLGFFGIMNVLYRGEEFLPSMDLLLSDAWNFLKKYLDSEILNIDHESKLKLIKDITKKTYYFLDPGNLMTYSLCLSNDTFMSSRILFKLLSLWIESSIYKKSVSRIPLDFQTFLVQCERLNQERGEGKAGPKANHTKTPFQSKAFTTSLGSSIDPKPGQQSPTSRVMCYRFSCFIKRSGERIIKQEEIETSKRMTRYFEELKIRMWEIFQRNTININQPRDTSTKKAYLDWVMVEQVIKIAQDSITPSFIGLLGLMHPEMKSPEAWDEIFESGWEFLRSYFSTWLRYLLEITHPIPINPIKNAKIETDWSNVNETINYLYQHGLDSSYSLPQRPVWYLVDLWYDLIKSKGSTSLPKYHVLSPHRAYIRQKCIQLDN